MAIKAFRWLILGLMCVLAMSVSAQEDAAIGIEDGDVYVYTNGERTLAYEPASADRWIDSDSLTWLGDGRFAFRYYPDVENLIIVSPDTLESEVITLENAVHDLPPTFSDDGQTVYYAATTDAGVIPPNLEQYAVIAQNISSGEQEIVGNIQYGTGCGGSAGDPMTFLQWEEIGYQSNVKLFTMSANYLLYTSACTGYGVSAMPLQTEMSPFNLPGLYRAALSPDGNLLAGVLSIGGQGVINTESLIVIDLQTIRHRVLLTTENLDQIGWGADGALYYSTRTAQGTLVDSLTELFDEQERTTITDTLGDPTRIPAYDVRIYRVDIATGEAQEVNSVSDAWGVGRFMSVNGETAVSIIPNGAIWFEAIAESGDDNFDGVLPQLHPNTILLSGSNAGEVIGTRVLRYTP